MANSIKRLIVCFDGTWNKPEDNTNVIRLFQAVGDENSGARDQLKFYDMGVGTDDRNKLRGGLFGAGVSDNIRQGYVWLCRNFQPETESAASDDEVFVDGTEIYLFGFSRGAFSARSLGGLISRCGLVRPEFLKGTAPDDARGTQDLLEKNQRDSPKILAAWNLYQKELRGGRDSAEAREFRGKFSHNVRVKMIGVWDTVGALGVPTLGNITQPIRATRLRFHDLNLSRIVDYAYHAIAIDEHRADFNVALWDKYEPEHTKELEQRWFPGAHSNVGGGYEDDSLADISLNWMVEKAANLGLKFVPEPWSDLRRRIPREAVAKVPSYLALRGDEYTDPVRDSYAEFGLGLYRRLPIFWQRLYRPMLTLGVNEWIDHSAQAKWNSEPDYRPHNLALAGSERRNQDVGVSVMESAA